MKTSSVLLKGLILVFLLLTSCLLATAEEKNLARQTDSQKTLTWGQPSNYVDMAFGYFISRSTCSWEISFPGQYDRGKSAVDFKGMDYSIPILLLDIKYPNSYVSISLLYGKGQSSNGEGTDSDYQAGALYLRSRFDVSGETTFWIADIQTTFSSHSKPRWTLKPFMGWQHHEEKIRMTNGTWTHLYGAETNTPFSDLDSRYDFNWDAWRVGIKGELEFFNSPQAKISSISLKSTLALFPYIHYRGSGQWNLRDDLKKDPSFSHEADNIGLLGLDGSLSLAYRPLRFLEVEGGGRVFYFYVQNGTNFTYYSNNTTATVTLNEAKALWAGLFLQIRGRF